jgi:hypothetical protein
MDIVQPSRGKTERDGRNLVLPIKPVPQLAELAGLFQGV